MDVLRRALGKGNRVLDQLQRRLIGSAKSTQSGGTKKTKEEYLAELAAALDELPDDSALAMGEDILAELRELQKSAQMLKSVLLKVSIGDSRASEHFIVLGRRSDIGCRCALFFFLSHSPAYLISLVWKRV